MLTFFSLLASCSEEKNDPEYPKLSQAELDDFLSQETIFLNFDNIDWTFGINDIQANGGNRFINTPIEDSIAITSALVNPDGGYFSLNAGCVQYNDDIDVLKKHFSIGDKTVGSNLDEYSISMNDPNRPNSTIDLRNIKIVKVSSDTHLYENYERTIKVWFLMDFNIKDNNSGVVVEKIRNAKYINEFYLTNFSLEQLKSGQPRYYNITTP